MKTLIALLVVTGSLLPFSFAQKPSNGKDGTIKVKKSKKLMLVVSPTAMNVLYIGVDNPIDVAIGGYSSDFTVKISNGSLSGSNGQYIARVNNGTTSTISVYSKNGKQDFGSYTFRLKRVPDPVAKFGMAKGSTSVPKVILVNTSGVIAEMENFDFNLTFSIVSFDIAAVINGFDKTERSDSNQVTIGQKLLLQSVKPGGKVYIENIKARGPDGTIRNLSPILIKVM